MPQPDPIKLPRLRTLQKDGIRRTTWSELLNDLVFTVIIAQLAQRLLTHLTTLSLSEFFLLYIPVWWLWNGETHYTTRFDNEGDVVHRFLTSLQLLVLLILAAAIPKSMEISISSVTYALAYLTVRLLLLVEYGRAWFYVPQAHPYIRHIMTGYAIAVVVWAVSIWFNPPYRYMLWAVALIIELSTPLTTSGGRLHQQFPPDARHLPERYGLFTLIVLGQAVTNTAQGLIQGGIEQNTLIATVLGGICIVGIWWAYFDRLDDDAVQEVSRGGSAHHYAFWLYLHLPLTIALTLVGVSFTMAIREVDSAVLPASVQWLLVGSVSGYFLAEGGISLTTLLAGPTHSSFVRGVVVRLGLAVILVGVRLTTSLNTLTLFSIIAGLVICLILSDTFGSPAPGSTERSL